MSHLVREMPVTEVESMVRYFLTADPEFLAGMGVDPTKLPRASDWLALLEADYARPLEARQFYYLTWEVDGVPCGHCNINKIHFGATAYMHLHIWTARERRRGIAAELLPPSIARFFEKFQLAELFCEPYANNPAPNRTLPKVGFRLIRSYQTTPGWICFHQPVNLWGIDRANAMNPPAADE